MIECEDIEIVRKCLSGNSNEFEKLIDKYQRVIFNIAYRMTSNYHDAEDITQAVFIKVYEKLDTFHPKFKFFSWIYRIAVNDTINLIKQKKRSEDLKSDLLSTQRTPEESFEEKELNEKLQKALMDIDPEYKILIILKHLQNFSYKEIAYIVDIPEKKVKSRLFSARQILRDVLEQRGITSHVA